jgi:hypothetical protein
MQGFQRTITIIMALWCIIFCTPWCMAEEKTGPVMVFDSDVCNFGKVKQHTGMNFDFAFHNDGDSPLTITRYQVFCDCTIIEEMPDTIQPGERGIIKGVFHSKNYKGEVERMIKLMTNEKVNETHVLYIKADVRELIKIEPPNTMMFPHEAKDGMIVKEIVVESVEGTLFRIKEIKSKVDFLTGKVMIEEEKQKGEKKDEEEKLKSRYNVQAIVDLSKIPDFGYFYIAVELSCIVKFEETGNEAIEQKTMLLIFNDQTML